ncbi:MAG: phosphoribosylglycinamide formyltransferase [Acidaminococcaceae bacterium]|nr:phosphoribosylglycinamide formyltransferase [Acidaminococcaceae bacterium]MDO4935399.1 phosphoribosylglycinamide formyltransferase [Phascolarctobacterium sp.]
MTKKVGVLVSGRGSNLQAIIDKIAEGTLPLSISVVITDVPGAFGLERATKAGIRTVTVNRKEFQDRAAFEEQINAALGDVDGVVLAGFMRILSADFINRWYHKIINIHPALLPSFTGLHAQRQAVEYGTKLAGCTVHFVDAGTDTGPIILQKVVPAYFEDDEDSLAARILEQEHIALPEALQLWAEDRLEIVGRRVKIN